MGVLDALYFGAVSVTSTGYGDITPVTDGARLVNVLVVMPAGVLFLVILVSTTLEVLAERTRTVYREKRWRTTLHDHTIVCGYGVKGRAAIETLLRPRHRPGRDRRDRRPRRGGGGGAPRGPRRAWSPTRAPRRRSRPPACATPRRWSSRRIATTPPC